MIRSISIYFTVVLRLNNRDKDERIAFNITCFENSNTIQLTKNWREKG